jgi:two-component system NarL family response regulator
MMNNIIIASSRQNRLSSWKAGLDGFVNTVLVVDKLTTLNNEVIKLRPKVLLLDFDLIGSNSFLGLRNICAGTKTIVIGAISEEMEWELLKAGVRGCCRSDSDPKFIRQVVEAVQQGELWIRRTLTCRLIDELGKTTVKNKSYQTSLGLLNKLTQREYDIAIRVGNGENNKQIAKACAITERTVKAHLTEVFQKLGVADRLNLALVLSADEKSKNPENLDIQLGNSFETPRPQIVGQVST